MAWAPGGPFKDTYELKGGVPRFKWYAAGKWLDGREWAAVRSPIDNSIIAYVPKLSFEEVEPALATVYEKGRWSIRDTPGYKRLAYMEKIADLLEERADELAHALVVNAGKTRAQAMGEVRASVARLRDASLDARKVPGEYVPGDWDSSTLETEAVVRREPYGVVLAIVPFNYPLFDAVSKFVYSTVAGNAVVIKPPSSDPLPVLMFAKLVEESGFPRDAFAVATIPGKDADRLVADERIHVVSLTGSSETGRRVLSAGGVKQYIMELGGGDPAVVLRDADLEAAARAVAAGIYSYAGQRCDAIKLVLVERDVYERFKEALVSELAKVKVGDPRDDSTTMGPLIDQEAVEHMMEAVRDALARGGRILFGGRHLGGNYVEPTLIEFDSHDKLVESRLYREEVFAPVALITWFEGLDQAIRLSNGRPYGLDAAIFGKDIDRIRRLVRYLEVGAVYINDMPRHGVGYYPFGGRKKSGIGREGIGYSVEHVMALKTIVYNFKGRGVYSYLV